MRHSKTLSFVGIGAAVLLAVPILAATPASAIIGGHDALESYPFLGSLQRLESPRDDLHVCGVSLLSSTIAITAAHCTRSGADEIDRPTSGHPTGWKVRFGSTRVDWGGQLIDVERFTQLNNRYFDRDLALLQLAEPVQGPTITLASEKPKPGTDVRMLGWGMTCEEFSDECFPQDLQEADTTVQDQSACDIDNEDLCIGALDGSVVPSNMDSGGPAIVKNAGRWELVGTVEGGGDGGPGYFTNVLAHRDWIDGLVSGAVPFPDDTPFPTDALSGTIRTETGCTGAVFQTGSSQPGDPALMLTNGHCTDPMPTPGSAVVGAPQASTVQILDEHGDTAVRTKTTELAYATMTGTDVAVYRLDTTYADLNAAGITVRTVSDESARAGQDIQLLAGGSAVALGCRIDAVVPTLREGGYELHGSLRYADGQECSDPDTGATHGDSGSVLVATDTDEIVGIHNTSVDGDDTACSDDNACEVDADGTTSVHEGARYGQRVDMLNACFTAGSAFAAGADGCTLTATGDVGGMDPADEGTQPSVRPGDSAVSGEGAPNERRRLPVVSG